MKTNCSSLLKHEEHWWFSWPRWIPCKCGVLDVNLAHDLYHMFFASSLALSHFNLLWFILLWMQCLLTFLETMLQSYCTIWPHHATSQLSGLICFNLTKSYIYQHFQNKVRPTTLICMIYASSEFVQNIKYAQSRILKYKASNTATSFACSTCLPF